MKEKKKRTISIPHYTLSEELINAISHGVGALLSIPALIVCIIKASQINSLSVVCVSIYGTTLILLYTMSCIYHSLSSKITAKKVLRVLDHCNVYMLVLGTYIPFSLLGIGGAFGWVLFGIVTLFTTLGIVFTAIDVDRFQVVSVICHLLNGWSILFATSQLYVNTGFYGVFFVIGGGVLYSVGALLYGLGSKHKYMHSVFHFFCLFGSLFHFLAIYIYVL